MPTLLLVTHANGASTAAVAEAAVDGGRMGAEAIGGVEVRHVEALGVTADDLAAADAVVFTTAEHFGTMSGGLKHAFDTTYNPLRDREVHRPWSLVVKAGNDGTGTIRDVRRICTGLGWREAREPVLLVGELTDEHLDQVREHVATIAAALGSGAV